MPSTHDPTLPALPALPRQPHGVPWPTDEWPKGPPPATVAGRLDDLIDRLCTQPDTYGTTYAAVVIDHGTVVAERYGGELPHFDRPFEPVVPDTALLSWSMAKSILHAAVGILVREGRIQLDAPAPVASWSAPEDPRRAITLQQLLEMRDGLDFVEEYTVDGPSDVVQMLFGTGQDDVAGYATARPAAHPPGTVWNYSSGTSNIVARIVGDVVGGDHSAMDAFLHDELFDRIGMRQTRAGFDDAGTFVGSSYVYAPALDFARFGLLYQRDGVWDGRRVLPEGWVDHGRRPRSYDEEDDRWYGAHWWSVGDDLGTFWASGYDGQWIMCVPPLDLIVVRLGKTPDELSPNLRAWRAEVRDLFRDAG